MSKTTGGMDEGSFFPPRYLQHQSPHAMEEMGYVLTYSGVESYIKHYDPDHVQVMIRHPYEELEAMCRRAQKIQNRVTQKQTSPV